MTGNKPLEHHLCEEHAREYLNASSSSGDSIGGLAAALAEGISKQMPVSKAAAEMKELDQQVCPICGISFLDYRNRGRLGCPNDYDCFSKQIGILTMNIHGETEHIGKFPKRAGKETNRRTQLIKLRRELDDAVTFEDYERAAALRDKIKEIETE